MCDTQLLIACRLWRPRGARRHNGLGSRSTRRASMVRRLLLSLVVAGIGSALFATAAAAIPPPPRIMTVLDDGIGGPCYFLPSTPQPIQANQTIYWGNSSQASRTITETHGFWSFSLPFNGSVQN